MAQAASASQARRMPASVSAPDVAPSPRSRSAARADFEARPRAQHRQHRLGEAAREGVKNELSADGGRARGRGGGDGGHRARLARERSRVDRVQHRERPHQAIVAGRRQPLAEPEQGARPRDQASGVAAPDAGGQRRARADPDRRVETGRMVSVRDGRRRDGALMDRARAPDRAIDADGPRPRQGESRRAEPMGPDGHFDARSQRGQEREVVDDGGEGREQGPGPVEGEQAPVAPLDVDRPREDRMHASVELGGLEPPGDLGAQADEVAGAPRHRRAATSGPRSRRP